MIVRSKRRETYTKIDNEIFKNVNDLVAVGLLAYLLSLPDDWIVYKKTIYPKFSQGRGAVDKGFKILKELGYLVGKNKRADSGKMNGYEWIVYETPFDRGFNRTTENSNTVNTELQKTELQKTVDMENRSTVNSSIVTTNNKQTTNKLETNDIKEQLNTSDKWKIFEIWLEYRKQIKKPIKLASIKSVVNRFNKEPIEKINYVVNSSIENGWQGLFWDKYKTNENGKSIIKTAESRSWNN